MEEVKLPVKYIVLPIYKNNENEFLDLDIIHYMVFRCYLVCEKKTYNLDGKSTMSYDVFCPYNTFSTEIKEEEMYPKYDLDGQCYKTRNVLKVFDTYDSAKVYSISLNYEIKLLLDEKKEEQYHDLIKKYQKLEYLFLDNTEYMCREEDEKRVLKP